MSKINKSHTFEDVGIVLIGRNEGNRLASAIRSSRAVTDKVIYVDSGSRDHSVDIAQSLGVRSLPLSDDLPFSASRARQEGYIEIRSHFEEIRYVLFMDADCQLNGDWFVRARDSFKDDTTVGAVCGWREESSPETTPYNRVCAIEWRMGKSGYVESFGGDVLISIRAYDKSGGYDSRIVAAEDDELSIRVRRAGFEILRIDEVATTHDANMTEFRQWFNRALRFGYGLTQVYQLHGRAPEKKFARHLRRSVTWGLIAPMAAITITPVLGPIALVVFLRYPYVFLKELVSTRRDKWSLGFSVPWAISCSLACFPEVLGVCRRVWELCVSRQARIIEYK